MVSFSASVVVGGNAPGGEERFEDFGGEYEIIRFSPILEIGGRHEGNDRVDAAAHAVHGIRGLRVAIFTEPGYL